MGKINWRAWWLVPAITAAALAALSLVKGLSGWTVFDALRPGTSAIDVLSAAFLLWIAHLALSRMRIDWRGRWVVPVAVVSAFLAMGFLEGFSGRRLDPPQFWSHPATLAAIIAAWALHRWWARRAPEIAPPPQDQQTAVTPPRRAG